MLPATDPPNRQILIGCGAFLELLCMAAAQLGHRAEVTLLPEGDYAASGVDARPFATVHMAADASARPAPLFAAVLSAAFLGEMPQPYHAGAFALIVSGIVVSSRR